MAVVNDREWKKQLGSFYSPADVAYYVASKVNKYISTKSTPKAFLDPAVGDGELLLNILKVRNNSKDSFIGVDIDNNAILSTSKRMPSCYLFNVDALAPNSNRNEDGWQHIMQQCKINHFDCIISNPPWGAEISASAIELNKFKTAKGQYDIYDLFIEKSLGLLIPGGVYAFILPDSIFRKEHTTIRKILLECTSIKSISRIGEFFFEGVNTSVTIIIGIKGYKPENLIECVHLPNSTIKDIINHRTTLLDADREFSHFCNQDSFISDNYNFNIDITENDTELIRHLDRLPKLSSVLSSSRGVELSKRGIVVQCENCLQWRPMPTNTKQEVFCPHCKCSFDLSTARTKKIVSENKSKGKPFLRGEDLSRYSFKHEMNIEVDTPGINYKSLSIYDSPKILIRKTGVGITAVLDYYGHIVNQVVYILRANNNCPTNLSLEFFIGLINSRITTYYIITKYGSKNWSTHPYLSQNMIGELPIPSFTDFTSEDWERVTKINNIVSSIYKNADIVFPPTKDLELEHLFLELFRLKSSHFKHIMQTISSTEQLIPFSRLMNIPKEKWDIVI